MINVPLLQGLKEYYDYINLCNDLGLKPKSFEDAQWKLEFKFLKNQLKGK